MNSFEKQIAWINFDGWFGKQIGDFFWVTVWPICLERLASPSSRLTTLLLTILPRRFLNLFNSNDSTSSRDFCGCGTVDVATQMQVRRLPGYVWLESSADHKVRAWVVWWYYFQQWQLFLTMCREERRLGGIDVE